MSDLEKAVAIAREAGACVRDCFLAGRTQAARKGHFDIVTAADTEAAALIASRLRAAFPADGLVCEENGEHDAAAGRRWFVDPLDGTKNFAHGLAHFCTMVACEDRGELALAVIYDPMREETFAAARGEGAWLNGAPLRASAPGALASALVASGYPSSKRHAHLDPGPFLRIARAVQGLRRTGSTGLDLAYTACGRFDAVWDWGLEAWDIAAGLLIVQEAGGVCRNWRGETYRLGEPGLVAAAPWLAEEIINQIEGPKE